MKYRYPERAVAVAEMTGAGQERGLAFFVPVIINVGSVRYIYNNVKKYP